VKSYRLATNTGLIYKVGLSIRMARLKVQIVYQTYLPSEFAMGPVSAIKNLIDSMGHECNIRLLTLNYDFLTEKQLFPKNHHVVSTPMATIEYLPRGSSGLKMLYDRLRERHDILEIHSGFDRNLAIPALILSRVGMANAGKVFHSPHGIFLPVDMSRGALKKRLYCGLSDLVELYKNVIHLASSPGEVADIQRWHRRDQRIIEVPHFVDAAVGEQALPSRVKQPKSLKIAFVGRVTLQKNLLFALEVVRGLAVPAEMDVFGDSDPDYQPACDAELAKGTGFCKVKLHGQIPHKDVLTALPQYDILLHPTLGENFGYSIIEALSRGIPVLLSDKSPWLDVENFGAGWVVALSHPDEFRRHLTEIYEMGPEWQRMREGAQRYAREKVDNRRSADARRRLYAGALVPVPDGAA
jgi:glycosyltransferase involved in cell wall biosynthesis